MQISRTCLKPRPAKKKKKKKKKTTRELEIIRMRRAPTRSNNSKRDAAWRVEGPRGQSTASTLRSGAAAWKARASGCGGPR